MVQDIDRILSALRAPIGNTDMPDGNLSFGPVHQSQVHVLQLAPLYDMLPMACAPVRGGELPPRRHAPRLPLPAEASAWAAASRAALAFWRLAGPDRRLGSGFRQACRDNAALLSEFAKR
ncbi:hypothetical protein QTI66_29650 [Variovorax sp. J22R133]|uniref:hypothetical protein n=1 Tax=Variovorax brevis TaxID=3053503 RepID=UPI0025785FE9|nr:hypothetical protein [Variovorax sp. J22R133]MDM0116327.1 hypothetical protein [Variovorax sp. J22R133]